MQLTLTRIHQPMKDYRCWHYLCRETARIIPATSSFEARKILAAELGVHVTDIVATTGE